MSVWWNWKLEIKQLKNAQFIYQLNQLKLSWWSDYHWSWTNAIHATQNNQLNNFYNLTGAKALPIFLKVFLIHFPSKVKVVIIKRQQQINNGHDLRASIVHETTVISYSSTLIMTAWKQIIETISWTCARIIDFFFFVVIIFILTIYV